MLCTDLFLVLLCISLGDAGCAMSCAGRETEGHKGSCGVFFFTEVLRSDRCLSQLPVNKQDTVFSACVSNEPFEQAREGLLLRLQLALLLSERPDIDFE